MNFKDTKAELTTVTRDLGKMEESYGNIYKVCNIISRRANQVSVDMKKELYQKLEEFTVEDTEDINEEYHFNGERIEVSQYYESLPKPNAIAIEEFMNDELFVKEKTEEEKEQEDMK